MDDVSLERSMLFDFYGDLLTARQREYFDLHCNEDLSLAEIAERYAVSRQSAWDTIARAEKALREYERKTGLLARFMRSRETLLRLRGELEELERLTEGPARELAGSICRELSALEY